MLCGSIVHLLNGGVSWYRQAHHLPLCRHTYATIQLTNGTGIYTVSKMLGHTNVRTAQIYAKVVDEKKEDAANAI